MTSAKRTSYHWDRDESSEFLLKDMVEVKLRCLTAPDVTAPPLNALTSVVARRVSLKAAALQAQNGRLKHAEHATGLAGLVVGERAVLWRARRDDRAKIGF